jgi:hypothetical protein
MGDDAPKKDHKLVTNDAIQLWREETTNATLRKMNNFILKGK